MTDIQENSITIESL